MTPLVIFEAHSFQSLLDALRQRGYQVMSPTIRAERWRTWDSCFTLDFSYVHGGSMRTSTKARYRHWLTHKLATWIDQFGTSGCVGCGRCIIWCPVAIDLTAEVRAIRESDSAVPGAMQEQADGNT